MYNPPLGEQEEGSAVNQRPRQPNAKRETEEEREEIGRLLIDVGPPPSFSLLRREAGNTSLLREKGRIAGPKGKDGCCDDAQGDAKWKWEGKVRFERGLCK